MTRYWIESLPQHQEAFVVALESLTPVWDRQQGHLLSYQGPYATARAANTALATCYGSYAERRPWTPAQERTYRAACR